MRAAVLTISVLLVAAAGCSSSPPPDATAPAGVSVLVRQNRTDQVANRTQVAVTNDGTAPITVAAAQILSARFTGRPAWRERDPSDAAVIAPGATVDLPAPLTAAVCPPAGGALAVRLLLRSTNGTTSWARLPATDGENRLATLQAAACTRHRVERIARIAPSFVPGPGPDRPGRLELTLTPAGGPGTLTLRAAEPTTLLTPGPVPAGTTVTGTGAPRTVTVPLRPSSCNQHVMAEDKVGTRIALRVELDGAPARVLLATSPALMGAAYDLVNRYCGRDG
jgi:hypothetical protein